MTETTRTPHLDQALEGIFRELQQDLRQRLQKELDRAINQDLEPLMKQLDQLFKDAFDLQEGSASSMVSGIAGDAIGDWIAGREPNLRRIANQLSGFASQQAGYPTSPRGLNYSTSQQLLRLNSQQQHARGRQ